MLNKEKYAKEIIEVLVQNNDSGLAVVKGKPKYCRFWMEAVHPHAESSGTYLATD